MASIFERDINADLIIEPTNYSRQDYYQKDLGDDSKIKSIQIILNRKQTITIRHKNLLFLNRL